MHEVNQGRSDRARTLITTKGTLPFALTLPQRHFLILSLTLVDDPKFLLQTNQNLEYLSIHVHKCIAI